jgi:hydroxymethylbilane synthase
MKPLRIGTRGSKLALWQANHLRDALREKCGVESEIVVIKTSGDVHATAPIEQLGIKGVFTAELEHALYDGRADVAIHSMKDVPTDFSDGCRIAVVFEREDPREVLISRRGESLQALPARARVGTSSLRRAAQLRRARPDLEILEIRGNVDTRIRKLDEGEYDAIVLAKAGVTRLGLTERITQVIEPEIVLPAVGQGALAVEYIEPTDHLYMNYFRKLEHDETVRAITAERAVMSTLHGGCRLPLGAYARFDGDTLLIDACVFSVDGTQAIASHGSAVCEGTIDARRLGERVANEMLANGADRVLAATSRATVR